MIPAFAFQISLFIFSESALRFLDLAKILANIAEMLVTGSQAVSQEFAFAFQLEYQLPRFTCVTYAIIINSSINFRDWFSDSRLVERSLAELDFCPIVSATKVFERP
ncbi:MAG: hypothetical protein SF097_00220 [Acidobacteriota bacterium]|nr:hypothetical protein [Acidobacteriota bacterium]